MKNGHLFYGAIKRLIEKYAHFNNNSDYDKFIMELATLLEI